MHLGTFFSNSIELFSGESFEKLESLKILMIPSKTELKIDIENDIGEKIINNIRMKVLREVVGNNEISVRLVSVDESEKSEIEISFIAQEIGMKDISIKFSVKDNSDVHSRLSCFVQVKKIIEANSLVFRDTKTNDPVGNTGSAKLPINIELLDQQIDFFRKVVRIQDSLNIKFMLPDTIYEDDLKFVNQVYELIKNGWIEIESIGYNVHDSEIVDEKFREFRESNPDADISFHCNIIYIEILGRKVEFKKDLYYYIPKIQIDDLVNHGNVKPNGNALLVYQPYFGESNIDEIVRELIVEKT